MLGEAESLLKSGVDPDWLLKLGLEYKIMTSFLISYDKFLIPNKIKKPKSEFKKINESKWLPANVPGSVMSDLLKLGLIEDPFYRDNEDKATLISNDDYEYQRNFEVSKELLVSDKVILSCEGLDTLCEIKINNKLIAKTENMHRTFNFDISSYGSLHST
jgi:hypothetical protein